MGSTVRTARAGVVRPGDGPVYDRGWTPVPSRGGTTPAPGIGTVAPMGPCTFDVPRRSLYLDALLAAGVFVAQVAGSLIEQNRSPAGPQLEWWGVATVAVACIALTFRRRAPFMGCAWGSESGPLP